MVDVVSIIFSALFIAILVLVSREVIENISDRALPFFNAPWQNTFLQIILWLILLFVVTAICFYTASPLLFIV